MTPDEIALMLASYKFRFVDELELHDSIAIALRDHSIAHEREYRLTPRDRLDFYLPNNNEAIALEVKIKGRAADVLRQLTRYAANPAISGLVLATTRRMHSAQMPFYLNGKSLGTALIGGGL